MLNPFAPHNSRRVDVGERIRSTTATLIALYGLIAATIAATSALTVSFTRLTSQLENNRASYSTGTQKMQELIDSNEKLLLDNQQMRKETQDRDTAFLRYLKRKERTRDGKQELKQIEQTLPRREKQSQLTDANNPAPYFSFNPIPR